MLIVHFHFKTEFFLLWKHTKCTLNFGLKSLKTSSTRLFCWALPRKENNDELLQGKFVAWSFHFPSQTTTKYFLQLPLFICVFHRIYKKAEERRFALAFLGMHQWANGWWLTDESERSFYFCYVIKLNFLFELDSIQSYYHHKPVLVCDYLDKL